MFVVLSRDEYDEVTDICVCKNIGTANYLVKDRNQRHPYHYCWMHEVEVL